MGNNTVNCHSCQRHTLRKKDVHGNENDCNANAEVDGQRMPKQERRHKTSENGCHGGGILLQYGVSILEEEGRQDALQSVVDNQQHGHLRCTMWSLHCRQRRGYSCSQAGSVQVTAQLKLRHAVQCGGYSCS